MGSVGAGRAVVGVAVKLLVVAFVVTAVSFVAARTSEWWKVEKVRRARRALVAPQEWTDEERLAEGFDDRPECPRGHGHMTRMSDLGWWCSPCSCAFYHQCKCGWWVPEDWTGCVKCGRVRPKSWSWL